MVTFFGPLDSGNYRLGMGSPVFNNPLGSMNGLSLGGNPWDVSGFAMTNPAFQLIGQGYGTRQNTYSMFGSPGMYGSAGLRTPMIGGEYYLGPRPFDYLGALFASMGSMNQQPQQAGGASEPPPPQAPPAAEPPAAAPPAKGRRRGGGGRGHRTTQGAQPPAGRTPNQAQIDEYHSIANRMLSTSVSQADQDFYNNFRRDYGTGY